MMRRLTWMSLAMLIATIVYWIVAYQIGKDFSALSGDDRHPTASCVIGKTELAWLVDRRTVVVSIVSDPAGRSLPLIGRFGVIGLLFNGGLIWNAEPSHRHLLLVCEMSTFAGAMTDGSPVTVRIVGLPYYRLVALFAVLPTLGLLGATWRRSRRILRSRRVGRVRQKRNGLGRCACGYDLRQTRNRCPECGRTIRWVPVSIPSMKRLHRVAK